MKDKDVVVAVAVDALVWSYRRGGEGHLRRIGI
jgi:hypothetical protein